MHANLIALCSALLLLAGNPYAGLAQDQGQVSGTFGPPALGQALGPVQRNSWGGNVNGLGGSFTARGWPGAMRFVGAPWQYPNAVPLSASAPWMPQGEPAPVQQLPPPAGRGAIEPQLTTNTAPAQPDQSFRGPVPEKGAAAPRSPSYASPVAAVKSGAPAALDAGATPRRPPVQFSASAADRVKDPAERVAGLLRRTDRIKKLSAITVTVQGQTATLRGRVASQSDRQLAEALARLEPGIEQVQNDLTVQPASPESAR
jgi:hypothetical protein